MEMENNVNMQAIKKWQWLFGSVVAFFGVIIACIVAFCNIQLGICHERLGMCKDRMAEIRTLKDNDFNQFVLIVRGDEKEREFIEQYSAFLKRKFKSEK